MRLSFRRAAGILFIGLLIEAAFVAGLLLAPTLLPVSPLRLSSGQASLYDEAWTAAEDSFYGQVPSETVRTYGGIRGMIQSYNDPYTAFFEPPATQQQSQQLAGKFGGIGATLRRETDGRIVLSPFPDRPAAQAGVQEGDVLAKINTQAVTPEMTFDAISQLLRGEVGTPGDDRGYARGAIAGVHDHARRDQRALGDVAGVERSADDRLHGDRHFRAAHQG